MDRTIVDRRCCIARSMRTTKVSPVFSSEGRADRDRYALVLNHASDCSGCDINSPRQAGLKGEKPDLCKTQETPLHLGTKTIHCLRARLTPFLLACQWGLERVVATLIEYHAEINKAVCSSRDISSAERLFCVGCRRQHPTASSHYQSAHRYHQSSDFGT